MLTIIPISILLIVTLFFVLSTNYNKNATPENITPITSTITNYTIESISDIVIKNPETSFKIVNNGDSMIIEDFEDIPMDKKALFDFAEKISNLQGTAINDMSANKLEIDGSKKITTHYVDNSVVTISLGNSSDKGVPCLVEETETIYMLPKNSLPQASFIPNNFVSKQITPSQEDLIKSVTLYGTNRSIPITISIVEEKNEDIRYEMTSPEKFILTKDHLTEAIGKIWGIEADSVAYINPSPTQLLDLGFDDPFSAMDIETDLFSITLKTTAPENNKVYIMYDGIPIIFTVKTDELSWITSQYGNFVDSMFIPPSIEELKSVKVVSPDKSFVFDIEPLGKSYKVLGNQKNINREDFKEYFKYITSIPPKDFVMTNIASPPDLSIELAYKTEDTKPIVIEFFNDGAIAFVSINKKIKYTTPIDVIQEIITKSENVIFESEKKASETFLKNFYPKTSEPLPSNKENLDKPIHDNLKNRDTESP